MFSLILLAKCVAIIFFSKCVETISMFKDFSGNMLFYEYFTFQWCSHINENPHFWNNLNFFDVVLNLKKIPTHYCSSFNDINDTINSEPLKMTKNYLSFIICLKYYIIIFLNHIMEVCFWLLKIHLKKTKFPDEW